MEKITKKLTGNKLRSAVVVLAVRLTAMPEYKSRFGNMEAAVEARIRLEECATGAQRDA